MMGAGLRRLPQHAIRKARRRDWKVGDVRGIQEVTITQPIAANLFSFKYLLAYFVLRGGRRRVASSAMQRRQAAADRAA